MEEKKALIRDISVRKTQMHVIVFLSGYYVRMHVYILTYALLKCLVSSQIFVGISYVIQRRDALIKMLSLKGGID